MSSRDIATAMLAAIQAGTLRPVIFYEGQFSSGTLRLWSGLGSKSWDGQTWIGTGSLLAIEGIEETTEARSVGFKISLSGLKTSNLALMLGAAATSENLPGKIWFGAIDSSDAVIADPYLARAGKMNIPRFEDGAQSLTITVDYEDENVGLLIPLDRRYTPEDQAIDYTGDEGFNQVATLQDTVILF